MTDRFLPASLQCINNFKKGKNTPCITLMVLITAASSGLHIFKPSLLSSDGVFFYPYEKKKKKVSKV